MKSYQTNERDFVLDSPGMSYEEAERKLGVSAEYLKKLGVLLW